MNGSKQPEGLQLPARRVPFPASVSNEARAALTRLVSPEGVPYNAGHVLPDLTDHDAWRALQRAIDAQYDARVDARATDLHSTVETVRIGPATVHIATPAASSSSPAAYLYLHGGALISGGGKACRETGRILADRHQIRCYAIDYRMPPDHPYPAALDDCLATYEYLLPRYSRIIVGGQSAGGNLAAALVARARDAGLRLPDGLVLLSPEVDLTESGDSFAVNRLIDVRLPDSLMACNLLYANGADLSHPYLSPLFADLHGWPPSFLQAGTRDLFLSNTVRMHRRLRQAGVAAELHVFEAMPHGGFDMAPEDEELNQEVDRFIQATVANPI
ncbi:alpha/beta hydrolase [Pseudomonas sp. GD03842]|uniref:alpha/beta hydrolase n=1 Tax=Pseudomonas sp. GD03842 TaxID=2975385 RepID=UPI00244D1813|nr:alpha/beta hydrolase [Pseudomonas sp. GD03842]MDH0748832.1 alpha/beta hydrolase [Pseudomonas sp. GD03842]